MATALQNKKNKHSRSGNIYARDNWMIKKQHLHGGCQTSQKEQRLIKLSKTWHKCVDYKFEMKISRMVGLEDALQFDMDMDATN